jgi:hypothetical protein
MSCVNNYQREARQLCPILAEPTNSPGGSTLFEKLFKRKSIIRRHQQAPLAEERRRYLAFKAEGGAARITLCATANYLLAVVSCMALRDTAPISRETIEAAASRWARSAPGSQTASLQNRFISVACSWLGFLGRLASLPKESAPYDDHCVGIRSIHGERTRLRR